MGLIEVLVAAQRIFAMAVIVISLLILVSAYRDRGRPELFSFLVVKGVIAIVAATIMLVGSLVLHPW